MIKEGTLFSRTKVRLKTLPFLMMPLFCVVHLGVYITLSIANKPFTLSFVNAGFSILYIVAVYLWAIVGSEKVYLKVLALLLGMMSVACIAISFANLGPSLNDALFTGTAVLTLFYVFENVELLLSLAKKYDRYLTGIIFGFIVLSLILIVFFPETHTEWGEGNFFFGHRYASVSGMVMILIGIKLTNKPSKPFFYWSLIAIIYFFCFWTGARVYVICNLGFFYSIIYCLKKNSKDFVLKCIGITALAVIVFFISPTFNKNERVVQDTIFFMEIQKKAQSEEVQEVKIIIDGLGNGRVQMWEKCIESYAKLPLINKLVGSGNKYMYDNNSELSSHMDFINILHFHGAIGLIIYLSAFIGGTIYFWRKNKLSIILLIGFLGIWFTMALLNGYASYTANMVSLPYIAVLAAWLKNSTRARAEETIKESAKV